jgi:hypothetical protein
MKVRVEVSVRDRDEAEAMRRGLGLPDVRALVVMMGILDALPNDQTRAQVLRYASAVVAIEERG